MLNLWFKILNLCNLYYNNSLKVGHSNSGLPLCMVLTGEVKFLFPTLFAMQSRQHFQ